jgi:hypothetical protein
VVAGSLVLAAGVAVSAIELIAGQCLPSVTFWRASLGESVGGVLIAAGSGFGEAVAFLAGRRRQREDTRVRQLWHYLEPIRRTMSPRLPAGSSVQKQIVDICDSLLLARRSNEERVRWRSTLVADAAGMSGPERDDFADAVELRVAVDRQLGGPVGSMASPPGLDVALAEVGSFDVEPGVQRVRIARLSRLVLRDGMVLRTARWRCGRGRAACRASPAFAVVASGSRY